MGENLQHIGLICSDANLRTVAELLIKDAGFEVASFSKVSDLAEYPAIEQLNALVITEQKGDEQRQLRKLPAFNADVVVPILVLSTFTNQSSSNGAVRTYPASFSWKQVISDLVALVDGNGESQS